MNPQAEIKQMRKEAFAEQDRELKDNFGKLNLENRVKLVIYSRELAEDQQRDAIKEKVLRIFDRLNKEGQQMVLTYLETLATNPKYRRRI